MIVKENIADVMLNKNEHSFTNDESSYLLKMNACSRKMNSCSQSCPMRNVRGTLKY